MYLHAVWHLCFAAPGELFVHHGAEDCSFLDLFPVEQIEYERELRKMLELKIIPRNERIKVWQLHVDVRKLLPP